MALNSSGVSTALNRTTVAHVATGAGTPTASSSAANGATRVNTDVRRSTSGFFHFRVTGTFVGTVILEQSHDNGTTWLPMKDTLGNAVSLTAPGIFTCRETEKDVGFRSNCTAYTSGTATATISQ